MVILIFFVVHWQVCVFCQSFFLHRYSAHKQFTMSPGWERFFYLFTYVAQGSSFLNPRGYAILHRIEAVKRPETRARKIEEFVAMLARGETVHPQRKTKKDPP